MGARAMHGRKRWLKFSLVILVLVSSVLVLITGCTWFNPRVTFTLYVHEDNATGPILVDAHVQGHDGDGNPFEHTTSSEGYVTIISKPGTWHFSVSKSGYVTNTWDEEIASTTTRHDYLEKQIPPETVTLTLYLYEVRTYQASVDTFILTDVRVQGHDGEGNPFDHITNDDGYVTITGNAGTWQFSASKSGYQTNTWDQAIDATTIQVAYLSKPIPAEITLTLYVHEGSTSGPPLYGVRVEGNDGDGNAFDLTTGYGGYVTLIGKPGTWHFTTSKSGYVTETWDEEFIYDAELSHHSYLLELPTLTLYIHENSPTGPVLSGVHVQGFDGAWTHFDRTTDSNGRVIITGERGTWHFTASKSGYTTYIWCQDIFITRVRHIYLCQEGLSGLILTLYIHDGYSSGPPLLGARVQGHDGEGNVFDLNTNPLGYVTIVGQPGTWHFYVTKGGCSADTWDEEITTTCTRHACLACPKCAPAPW